MSHIYFIVVIFKTTFKGESVIRSTSFAFHLILVVADILTSPEPANPAGFSGIFDWIEKRLLALIVGAVWLDQIYYVEFVADVLANIAHLEVVPLCICRCPVIVFQYQIVGVFADAKSSSQVTRLEPTLEH